MFIVVPSWRILTGQDQEFDGLVLYYMFHVEIVSRTILLLLPHFPLVDVLIIEYMDVSLNGDTPKTSQNDHF